VCAIFWFFQHWVSNLPVGLVGALVGGAISFFGALIDARMQARTSFEVQRKDFESRSKAARLADEALIRGTVQSISDEVEALWAHYNGEIGPHLDSLEPEQPANVFNVTPSYFAIFDAAGSLVGRIPNPTLRSKIIDFYVGAKSVIDSLQYYERLRTHHEMTSNPDRAHEIWREVLRYSTQLQSMNVEFGKLYEALRPELDRFLGVPSDQETP
jgi:hypothetical protein